MTNLITYFLLFYSLTTTTYIVYLKTWTCRSFITSIMFLLGVTKQLFCNVYVLFSKKFKKESSVAQPFMQEQNQENMSTV